MDFTREEINMILFVLGNRVKNDPSTEGRCKNVSYQFEFEKILLNRFDISYICGCIAEYCGLKSGMDKYWQLHEKLENFKN